MLFEAIAAVPARRPPAILPSGMRPSRRLFIPLQLLLRFVSAPPPPPPRVSPKGSSRDGILGAAKDAMTISLRALGGRYRPGVPIFRSRNSPGAARGRDRGRERKKPKVHDYKAARLVCLAKAFLCPTYRSCVCRCTAYPREYSFSSCRRIYCEKVSRFAADRVRGSHREDRSPRSPTEIYRSGAKILSASTMIRGL